MEEKEAKGEKEGKGEGEEDGHGKEKEEGEEKEKEGKGERKEERKGGEGEKETLSSFSVKLSQTKLCSDRRISLNMQIVKEFVF